MSLGKLVASKHFHGAATNPVRMRTEYSTEDSYFPLELGFNELAARWFSIIKIYLNIKKL